MHQHVLAARTMNKFSSTFFHVKNRTKRAFVIAASILLLGAFTGSAGAQEKKGKFEIRTLSPEFSKLVSPDAKLTTVATGFGFTEGPVWDPAGFLYVSDETINKIYRVHLKDGR